MFHIGFLVWGEGEGESCRSLEYESMPYSNQDLLDSKLFILVQ